MQTVLQIAAEAARQTQLAQSVVSHNLANASTTAFKADLYQAESLYVLGGNGASGATSRVRGNGIDYSPGNIQFTGRDLDVAITTDGWMKVVTEDGTQGLSRRGDLRVDVNGQLIDAQGNAMMGEGGPITLPPFSQMTLASDGTISIVPLGEPPTTVAVIDRLMLVNPPTADLRKGPNGLYDVDNIDNLDADANVQLSVGALETSNVNPITAMVEMIELARSFESHVQTMKSSDELDTSSASLMRLE